MKQPVKIINVVVIDGEEKEISGLSDEERKRLVNEWNQRALGVLGYEKTGDEP